MDAHLWRSISGLESILDEGLAQASTKPLKLPEKLSQERDPSHTLTLLSINEIVYIMSTGSAEKVADRKSTRLNSSHSGESRMPSSA